MMTKKTKTYPFWLELGPDEASFGAGCLRRVGSAVVVTNKLDLFQKKKVEQL